MKKLTILIFALIAFKSQSQTTNYYYDNLSRLIIVNYSNGASIIYSYDDNGNRTTVATQAGELPIKLIAFSAQAKECNSVQLGWQTANEQNNKGFDIESSTDGIKFNTISFVEASNSNNYGYLVSGLQDGDYYFRLKQIDNDGKFSYSPIQKSGIHCNNKVLNVYPNPTSTVVNIKVGTTNKTRLILINAMGRIVKEQNLTSGNNAIDISSLSKGLYIVEIISEGLMQSEKLMIE